MTAEEWIKENICMDVHEIREFRGDRIAELMEQYAKEKAVEILNHISEQHSPYSIMYGNREKRFATSNKDYSSDELYNQFNNN